VVAVLLASYQHFFRSAVDDVGADASDAIRRTVEWSVWNSQQLRGVSAAVEFHLRSQSRLAATNRATKIAASALAAFYGFGLALTVSRGAWISLGLSACALAAAAARPLLGKPG